MAGTPEALDKAVALWKPNADTWERLGDSLFTAAVKCDMAGQLMVRSDSKPVVKLAASADEPFLNLPWVEAIAEYKARGIVSERELSTLMKDYAQRSDAARRLMLAQIQEFVREAVVRSLEEGSTLAEFSKTIRDGGTSLGITADNPHYLECLPADASVTGAVVTAAHRRWHEGSMVEVITEGGRTFSATPNHPMLTRAGWRTAGELREGDNLVGYAREQCPGDRGHEDVTAPPPSIAEVFNALALVGSHERVGGTALDFHGDGSDRDVDVVRAARPLRVRGFSAIQKPLGQHVFTEANCADAGFCHVCGNLIVIAPQRCGFCDTPVLDAAPAQPGENGTLVRAETGRERTDAFPADVAFNDLVGGNVVSRRLATGDPAAREVPRAGISECPDNPGLVQPVVEARQFDADGSGHVDAAHAGDIEFDRVASVTVREFSGHVYNLSTTHGYFAVSGLVTGNTVFRTNVQSAYGAGRYRAMTDPVVMNERPYVEYRTTGDARVRDSHRLLDGTIYAVEGEAWRRIAPPNSYNCRCAAVMLTREELAGRKVLGDIPAGFTPEPGFDGPPVGKIKPTPGDPEKAKLIPKSAPLPAAGVEAKTVKPRDV